MIDWIDAMCRTWGYAKRGITYDKNMDFRPEGQEKDGPPFSGRASSFAGRANECAAGIDSGFGPPAQPLEVFRGDALLVSCAIQGAIIAGQMKDEHYEALFIQYVVKGPLKTKMDKLRIGRKAFYERVHRAHKILKPWLRENRDNVTVDGVTPDLVYRTAV